MDKLKAFIQAMTFWNWLSLSLVIPALLGGLNAALSLRSRFRDWRGIQSKREFAERLEELKTQLAKIESAKKNPTHFFVHALSGLVTSMGITMGALFLFMGAVVIHNLPLRGFVLFEFLYLVIGMLVLGSALVKWKDLAQTLENADNPLKLGKQLLDFVYAGRAKGFIAGHEDFIRSLINNKVFSEDEKVQLFSLSFDLDRKSINEHSTKPVHRDNGADDY